MTLKIAAALGVLAWLAVPLVLSAWMAFPLTAGLALWLLWRFNRHATVNRFLKPILLLLLLGFVAWLVWIPKFTVPSASYASGTANAMIRAALGGVPPATGDPAEVRERQEFASALARARQKVDTIATALLLYNSADAVSVNRNGRGLDDAAGLRPALETLRAALQPPATEGGTPGPNLLNVGELESLANEVRTAIDDHEQKALAPTRPAAEIRALRLGMVALLAPFRVDSLYAAVSSVEAALRNTLKLDVPLESRYRAHYDRSTDRLVSEQEVTIRTANLHPQTIDVCGFLASPGGRQTERELRLNLDGLRERVVSADECRIDVREARQQLVITHRGITAQASRPILTDRFWMSFRAISVDWPLPLVSSAVLTLAFPDDPTLTWPLAVPVETPLNAALEYVAIPRNSFYFAAPPMTPNDSRDLLLPEAGTPRISALATGERISIELLPRYLSNETGQKYKAYVAAENLVGALAVMIVTALLAALVSPRSSSAGKATPASRSPVGT
jgi:hypothetical protein